MPETEGRLQPLQAAELVAGVERVGDAVTARVAGLTDMLWGLALPAMVFAARSYADREYWFDLAFSGEDEGLHPAALVLLAGDYAWAAFALGAAILTSTIAKDRSVSLGFRADSGWFWAGLALGPFLALPGAILLLVVPGLHFVGFVQVFVLLAGGYLIGRGLALRRKSWYRGPWALVLGACLIGLALVQGLLTPDTPATEDLVKLSSAAGLGLAFFTHGSLVYRRG